jgi:regulation of enolase protein 1 (concanavalin A-like superfamily)
VAAYSQVPGTSGETDKRLAKRPSVEEARAALNDLLDKIRFEKVRVNEGYLKALGLKAPEKRGELIDALPGPQEWKNAPASWKFAGGVLTIESGKSTDWFISPMDGKQTGNAPLLLFRPAAEFTLTAKVTPTFAAQWDAGVITVWVNETTWAKLAFEKSVYQEPTIVSVVTRGVSDDCNSSVISGGSVWFRIARVGDGFGFFHSADGRSWKMVRSFTLGEAPDLRVGFGSQSPVGGGATAVFSEISYKPEPIKDFFAGQ